MVAFHKVFCEISLLKWILDEEMYHAFSTRAYNSIRFLVWVICIDMIGVRNRNQYI